MSCPYHPRPTPVLVPGPCSAWQQHGSSSSQRPARILERRRGPKGSVGGSGDPSPWERPRLDCIPDAFLFKLGFKGFLVGFGFWGVFFFGREITFLEGLRRVLVARLSLTQRRKAEKRGGWRSKEAGEARVAIGWADGAGTGCLPRPPPWEGSRGPGVLLAPPTAYPTKGQPAREGQGGESVVVVVLRERRWGTSAPAYALGSCIPSVGGSAGCPPAPGVSQPSVRGLGGGLRPGWAPSRAQLSPKGRPCRCPAL